MSSKSSGLDGMINALVIGGDTTVTRFMNSIPLVVAENGTGYEKDLSGYDMIVFTGGADVDPAYYGEGNRATDWMNEHRDQIEFSVFHRTRDTHYHFGICRGLQLMAVANGTPLWQDIREHTGSSHAMSVVPGFGEWGGKVINGVTSAHHQALRVTDNNKECMIAYSDLGHPITAVRWDEKTTIKRVVEAAWFKETRCFGVQGHPEYGGASEEFKQFVEYHLIDDMETGFYANLKQGDRQCAG